EKALTGESHLLSKKEGDLVFASTVVVEGHLVVEVERSGKNTEAAKIERILNTVGSKPLTLQRDALDFASKLVLPTFGVAWLAAALASDECADRHGACGARGCAVQRRSVPGATLEDRRHHLRQDRYAHERRARSG